MINQTKAWISSYPLYLITQVPLHPNQLLNKKQSLQFNRISDKWWMKMKAETQLLIWFNKRSIRMDTSHIWTWDWVNNNTSAIRTETVVNSIWSTKKQRMSCISRSSTQTWLSLLKQFKKGDQARRKRVKKYFLTIKSHFTLLNWMGIKRKREWIQMLLLGWERTASICRRERGVERRMERGRRNLEILIKESWGRRAMRLWKRNWMSSSSLKT